VKPKVAYSMIRRALLGMTQQDRLGLLKEPYRSVVRERHGHPLTGLCYAASEAFQRLVGDPSFQPCFVHVGPDTLPHWFVCGPQGKAWDLTAEQFDTPVDYTQGHPVEWLGKRLSRGGSKLLHVVQQQQEGAVARLEVADVLAGGRAEGMSPDRFNHDDLHAGILVEHEHARGKPWSYEVARRITMDHLAEDPDYYRKLATIHVDSTEEPAMSRHPQDYSTGSPRLFSSDEARLEERPWINPEHAGKLGEGFLSWPWAKRKAALDNAVQEYGYRSTLGSIMVLERSRAIRARHEETLMHDRRYLVATYGGEGSFGSRVARMEKPPPRVNAVDIIAALIGYARGQGWDVDALTVQWFNKGDQIAGAGYNHAPMNMAALSKVTSAPPTSNTCTVLDYLSDLVHLAERAGAITQDDEGACVDWLYQVSRRLGDGKQVNVLNKRVKGEGENVERCCDVARMEAPRGWKAPRGFATTFSKLWAGGTAMAVVIARAKEGGIRDIRVTEEERQAILAAVDEILMRTDFSGEDKQIAIAVRETLQGHSTVSRLDEVRIPTVVSSDYRHDSELEDHVLGEFDRGTRVQTIMLARESFTQGQAVQWAVNHGFRATKLDVTDNYYRLRQADPSTFDPSTFRTITLRTGVKAVVAVPL